MLKFDTMPKWLQDRVTAVLGIQASKRPPFVGQAAARAEWDRMDGQAQAAYLGTVNRQLLQEAQEVMTLQAKAVL